MTTTLRFLYKNPSQVAQEDTPWVLYLSSPGMPSHLLSAPVATIKARVVKVEELVAISKGYLDKSIVVAQSSS
jgi:hypothetical protein